MKYLAIIPALAATPAVAITRPGGPTCFGMAGQAFDAVGEPLPPLGDEG